MCGGLVASPIASATTGSLSVKIQDAVSNLGLAGLTVDGYEKQADGTLKWVANRVTDSTGLTKFDLEGQGTGKVYVFKVKPYGYTVTSAEQSQTGWYTFKVGQLQVQVLDGQTGQGKAGQSIQIKRWESSGSHTWILTATTDSQGWIKVDPPAVGLEPYIATAQSPTDGQWKESEKYWSKGPHTFVLGNAPIVAKEVDGISGGLLSGMKVEAKEKQADGSLLLKLTRWTDAGGQAKFDLDVLGGGKTYVLETQPYLQKVSSGEISAGGEQELRAGKLQVTVLNGMTGATYPWKAVTLKERKADGSYVWVGDFTADGEGKVRLDPAELGVKSYVLAATSPMDGTEKYSEVYSQGGSYQYKVGGVGLSVKIQDAVSNLGLAGLTVDGYEKQADGTLKWVANRVTDSTGLTKFDLEGQGTGKVYVFKVKPYGYTVTSAEQSQTGWYTFKVGQLQVQVLDGQTGQGKAGQSIQIKRWESSGSHTWILTATTDSQGWIKVDPPAVGLEPYIATAQSPTDGQWKESEKYWSKGPHTFVLGNAPIVAKVVDGISGGLLSGMKVEAKEKQADGSLLLKLTRWTDAGGQAKFDLDVLGGGKTYVLETQPYLQKVSSGEISAGGEQELRAGKLQVTVLNGMTGATYPWKAVTLKERKADGSYVWVGDFTADGEGKVRLDPAELGVKSYVLAATSPMDGTEKYSEVYSQGGSYQYKIGGVGLSVKIQDAVSNLGLAGLTVDGYEKQADGTLKWVANRVTDSTGLTKFDLEGLGTGKVYVFKVKPYGYTVTSAEQSQTGWYTFKVGQLQVQVLDGQTGQGKAGQSIQIKRWESSGSHTWILTATTDSQGWIKVDPPAVGLEPYIATAQSPTDGQWKESEKYWSKGPHTFVLGNAPIVAKVVDGISGGLLSGMKVEAKEKQADGSLLLKLTRWTDAGGQAKFDLDVLGGGKTYVLETQPYLQKVSSGEISAGGEQELRAGKLQVTVLNGMTGATYPWKAVTLKERKADGSYVWVGDFTADGEGKVRLDPAELGVKSYVLAATSPMDGTEKYSEVYSHGGSYQYKVGGVGLSVKIQDAVSNLGLAGLTVDGYEKQADGTLKWVANRVTDSTGLTKFDLEGLGTGKVYVFKVKPYGYTVTSAEQSQTGWYTFKVGTTKATLTDAATGLPITGQSITAFEKLPSGTLQWAAGGTTDGEGVIRFDLAGSNTGRVYVLRADNPFLDGVYYYSQLITYWGAVDFALSRGSTNKPDTIPPTVQILSPDSSARVSRGGFKAYGFAGDDKAIKEVRLLATLPDGSLVDRLATFDAASGEWSVDSGAFTEAAPGTLAVTVKALDNAFNEAVASLDLELVVDTTPPVLTVLSHVNNANVPMGGFLISGVLSDDTANPTLTAQIEGGGLTGITSRPVEVATPTGNWGLVVSPVSTFTSTKLKITLSGVDGEGNATSTILNLQPSDSHQQAWHVLARTGFGAEPGLLDSVVKTGVTNYLGQQLYPDSVSDTEYEERLALWGGGGAYLATDFLRRGVFSSRRLQNLMAWFWDNHFNTDFYSHNNSAYEQSEMEAFRGNAMGRFRDILQVSATSPAMLTYLDSISNKMGAPNENYARELLELHTLGVGGGYTQQDVEEAARAFTGWTVKDGAFYYDPAIHDNGAKTVLGMALPAGGGQADGEAILDLLAGHASTASFLCTKLVTLLVDDVPVDSLVSQCAAVFLSSTNASDQMGQVVWSILSSQEFLGTGHRLKKLKTPLEFGVSVARNLGLESDGDDLAAEMTALGIPLFAQSMPTGYAEVGTDWISTSLLLKRVNFLDRFLGDDAPSSRVFLKDSLNALGAETQEAMVGRLLEWTLGPNFTGTHWQWAMDFLSNDGSRPYYNWSTDAETRLRGLGRALLSLPDSQYQ